MIRGAYQWQYVYFEGLNDYGYIRSDCYAYTTSTGEATAKPSGAIVTQTPAPSLAGRYALTAVAGATLHQTENGVQVTSFPLYTQLDIVAYPGTYSGSYPTSGWFRVKSGGYEGYIHQDKNPCAERRRGGCLAEVPHPAGRYAPRRRHQPPVTGEGMLRITLPGTNLRKTPGGLSLEI